MGAFAGLLAPLIEVGAVPALLAGLVAGAALGVASFMLVWREATELPGRPWIAVTTVVVAAVWAAEAIAPGPLPLTAGILVLAAGQQVLLRGRAVGDGRWWLISVASWILPMVAVIIGISFADDREGVAAVGVSVLTGLVAGALLGAGYGLLAPSLDGQPLSRRVLLWTMCSPFHRMLPGSMVGLAVRGRSTGLVRHFPVTAAADGLDLVVVPGHPEAKQWWRNLRPSASVRVCRNGRWDDARAALIEPGDPERDQAVKAYTAAHPKVTLTADAPLVRLTQLVP